jgi:hypothetical protein
MPPTIPRFAKYIHYLCETQYHFHAGLSHNDKLTRDVLALIEQLASTNTLIADEIHAKIQ